MYAKSVEHAARKNTARREAAYESLAARCKSGASRPMSVVECRIRLITCGHVAVGRCPQGNMKRHPHLVRIRRVNARMQLRVEPGLKEGRRHRDTAYLS